MKAKLSLIVMAAASLAASESFSENYYWKGPGYGRLVDLIAAAVFK